MNTSVPSVTEPAKRVPVVRDVDVVVAGAGCAGVFAALAAAAEGACTVLVERTGMLGGNAGPGMLFGCTDPMSEGPKHLPRGNTGIVKTVERRMIETAAGRPWNRCFSSSVFSETVAAMMDEHGVELLMPAYAADPLLVDGRVAGLFVETKSGRVAIRARTVIDATAEADIAMRAGAPMIRHVRADPAHKPAILDRYDTCMNPSWSEENWNEVGLMYVVAGIDWTAYQAFLGNAEPVRFKGLLPDAAGRPHPRVIPKEFKFPGSLFPKLRAAWESGEFRHARELRDGALLYWQFRMIRLGADTAEDAIAIHGDIDVDDWKDVATAEHAMRTLAGEAVRFMRRAAPGFENAWVLATSPFIGARGGPCIEGEAVVRPEHINEGRRQPDVVLRAIWETQRLREQGGASAQALSGYDLPYRMMLPKGLDGILVVGRGSSYLRRGHDPATRGRIVQFHLGEVAGVAAALAAKAGVSVRSLDVTALQRKLLDRGVFLGENERLRELGLG